MATEIPAGPGLTDEQIESIATGGEWESLKWVTNAATRKALTWALQWHCDECLRTQMEKAGIAVWEE